MNKVMNKANCSKCGREEDINDYIAERLKENDAYYVCSYCNAELADKNMRKYLDRIGFK